MCSSVTSFSKSQLPLHILSVTPSLLPLSCLVRCAFLLDVSGRIHEFARLQVENDTAAAVSTAVVPMMGATDNV